MQAFAHAAIEAALDIAARRSAGGPPVVAIAGAQGSGKSWLARAFAQTSPGIATLSLDDFYLPAAARRDLGRTIHPLFTTRGVPGTHDVALLNTTLDALRSAGPGKNTALPVFDKLQDDVLPPEDWRSFQGRPDAILLEGWCLGATAEAPDELAAPINDLERNEDRDGIWRRTANTRLGGDYAALFDRLDAIVFLAAPSFDVVHAWRCEQEESALGRALSETERQRIARFIAFFERITRHMLAGGRRSDVTIRLDARRKIENWRVESGAA